MRQLAASTGGLNQTGPPPPQQQGGNVDDEIREAIRRNEENGTSGSGAGAPMAARSADLRSHFQYILRNLTETSIAYVQTQTADARALESGQEVSFSFSNPYQPKLLEIALEGWSRTAPFPIDAPGTHTTHATHTTHT
jgi:hypothetical protein